MYHKSRCFSTIKLFFKWGIEFEKTPYEVPLRDNSTIKYACKDRLTEAIRAKYHPEQVKKEKAEDDSSNSIFIEETMSEQNQIRVRESSRKLHVDKKQDGEAQ